MKLDYKTPINNFRLRAKRFARRNIHLGLAGIAVICFTVAIVPGRSSDRASSSEVSTTALSLETSKGFVNNSSKDKENSSLANFPTVAELKNNKEVSKEISESKTKSDSDRKSDTNTAAIPAATASNANIASNTANKNDANSTANATPATWETIKISKNDTLAKVFNRSHYRQKDLQGIMSTDKKVKTLLTSLQPGQTLKLLVHNDAATEKQVDGLTLAIAPGESINILRKNDKFEVEHTQIPLEKKIAFGKGEIHASLSGAAKRAGLDNKIVAQMVEIFGGNIDFSQDLRPNDTFRVLFEQKCLDQEPVQTGAILAAEFINDGTKIQAIRYTDSKTGTTGYFSPEGHGLNQAFLRSPVNFTSISSGFGKRKHPVYHKLRQHKGVDYAAPRGTPVQATGDAKVIFVGNKSGYGKVIELQHGARYSTLYAHLSRFATNLKVGTEVKQGQVIGYVGRTGLATGDHLHYEFRIDGIHRDPLTVALPKSKFIPDAIKRHFVAHAKEMIRLMDDHENKVKVAAVEY